MYKIMCQKNYVITYYKLHNIFEEQLCVFFTSIDSSHYSMHKSIKIQLLKNE